MGNFVSAQIKNPSTLDLSNEQHVHVIEYIGNALHNLFIDYQNQQQQYQKGMTQKSAFMELFQLILPNDLIVRFETSLSRDQIGIDLEKKSSIVEFRTIYSVLYHLENASTWGKHLQDLKSLLQHNKKILLMSSSGDVNQEMASMEDDMTKNLNEFEDTIKDLIEQENSKAKESDLFRRLQFNNFIAQFEIHLFSNFIAFRKKEKSSSAMPKNPSLSKEKSSNNSNDSSSSNLEIERRRKSLSFSFNATPGADRSEILSTVENLGRTEMKPKQTKTKKHRKKDTSTYSFLLEQKGISTDPRFLKKDNISKNKVRDLETSSIFTIKPTDSSDEEESIAVTLPKNHDVSPLVARINKMVKVIRQNTPETEFKEAKQGQLQVVPTTLSTTSQRNIILAISFFQDLDMGDVSNQYAIVECGGIPTFIKLFEYNGDERIRIGAANILSHLSNNSRIQLTIAENIPSLLRTLNMGNSTDLSKPSRVKMDKHAQISFQKLVCEVIANCCERLAVRRIITKCKGIKKIFQFLYNCKGFFDGSGNSSVNIFEHFKHKTNSLSRPFSTASTQTLQESTPLDALSIIYNSLRVVWTASKRKFNQEDILNVKIGGEFGISILDLYLDQLFIYLKDCGNEADTSVVGPYKLLVPVIGSFMHCAENENIRTQMRNSNMIKKLLVVVASINNIMTRSNVYHIDLLIVMAGLLFNLTVEKYVREQINTILEIMGSWTKRFAKQSRNDPERSLILLEYITGAMYNASFSMENAEKIFELGLLPSLTGFLDINFIPKKKVLPQPVPKVNVSANLSPTRRRRKSEIHEPEEVIVDSNHISSLLKTKSIEKSDELIKFRCAGIIANCAKLPWTKLLIFKSCIVDYISPLLVSSSKTDLIVHCLDILGRICNCNSVLDSMLKQGAMKAMWSMLRNEKPEIQAAAAMAISNCIHNADIAARIGETYVSGIGVLVRVLESSKDIFVLANICLAIAKMSQNSINRAIFTEEGACTHIANMLMNTQKWIDDLMVQMSTKPKTNDYTMCTYETESGEKKKLVYDNPDYNKRLDENLYLRSMAALAIAELGKHQHNSISFFEKGVVDPLIENIKFQRMLQKHYDSNHRKHYENTAMVEILSISNPTKPSDNNNQQFSKTGSFHFGNSMQHTSQQPSSSSVQEKSFKKSQTKISPFVCHSLVCAPYLNLTKALTSLSLLESNSSTPNEDGEATDELYENLPTNGVTPSDIDCHYHHIFRNTSYALSVLSENEIVSKTLRICNTVNMLVRLLSAKNDALQLSAANAIANVRKYHVSSKITNLQPQSATSINFN